MLLREFLGIRLPGATARTAGWIRSQQRADGTWSNFHGGPGDLSTTIEAYVALRLAGDSPADEHMRAARRIRPRRRRPAARARLHPHLDGAVRRLAVGPGAGAAAGADPAAGLVSAERLRLRLLGAADGRRAVGRALAAPGAAAAVHARRARRLRALVAAVGRLARSAVRLVALDRVLQSLRAAPAGAAAQARAVAVPSAGSSTARRPTAAGAGSSLRGSTR